MGGCVRDSLLGRPVHDWDLASSALPDQVLRVFSGDHCLTNGLPHGTVTVVRNGKPYEITTFRKDGPYGDHRRPETVRLGVSLRADLARRDFTVNAMAYSEETGLVDPFRGEADLRAGILRAVGDADCRFSEDALRILRALRFASELGFVIERATSEAMHRQKAGLAFISAERIGAEFTRLLCGADAARVLMTAPEIILQVLPELRPCLRCAQNTPYH